MTPQTGVSLVELSLALVIIALVIGGVLFGADLVYTAELRSQVGQIEKVNLAVVTFREKYGCLPGDCADATGFFGATSQNGNSNGRITGFAHDTPWNDNPIPPSAVSSWVGFASNDGAGNLAECASRGRRS